MLVEMRTIAQAARVAALPGCVHQLGKPDKDGRVRMSRRVDVGDDFEVHRQAVESVSVLFSLYHRCEDELTPMQTGWTVTGASFEVEWPSDPKRALLVRSHFGGRRYAYNWALAQVRADMDAKVGVPEGSPPGGESVAWNAWELRKRWNADKDLVAPWWAVNSKEAYSSGIDDLVKALGNWRASRAGKRRGHKVGFPKFRSKRKGHGRVRFTTGTMRFDDDRRTIAVPVIGELGSKENTRRVQRPLAQGRARILNMTVFERWGRLFVSVNYALRTPSAHLVEKPGVRAGVDLGLRTLATVCGTDGNIIEFPNPAPLRATLAERRKAGRQMARRIPGSRGHLAAKIKLAKLDRRAVHLRREGWHRLTTWLAATYREVVIEDLDIAAIKRSMGRRAFRRSVSDAGLGMFRPMLTYKMGKAGTAATVAGRWYPSSQIHHGCGCRLVAPTKLAKQLVCAETGELVDRDHNASKNLRDWPEIQAGSGPVGSSAPADTQAALSGGTAPGSGCGTPRGRRSDCQTIERSVARRGEARNKTPRGEATE